MRITGRAGTTSTAALALLLAAGALPQAARAAADTVTVNSTLDPGDGSCATNGCTLREAMTLLDDGDLDVDRIRIAFSGVFNRTITLGTSLPVIDEALTIEGAGLVTPVVSAAGKPGVRPFAVDAPAGVPVTLDGLVVAGAATGVRGVSDERSRLTITDSAIVDNLGGGVESGGDLVLRRTTISGNRALVGGGVAAEGTLLMEQTTVSGNRADVTAGGVSAVGAQALIDRSTVSGNQAAANSGGILLAGATTVTDSTVTGNAVTTAGSSDGGGGMFAATGDPIVRNSIVAGNTSARPGPDLRASGSSRFQLSFTLVGDPSDAAYDETVPGSNLLGADPQLGPLAANGGPTWTHLPAATSPVIDRGAGDRTTDQRLAPRPQDDPAVPDAEAAGANAADIGAVELPAPPPPDPTPAEPAPAPAEPGATEPGTPPAGPAPAPGPTTSATTTPQARPGFGRSPRITLSLAGRAMARGGHVRVRITNRNLFGVTGRLTTTAAVRVRGRRVALPSRAFRVAANGRTVVTVRLPARLRAVVAWRRAVRLRLRAGVRDPRGATRTVARVLVLRTRATR